MKNKSVNRRDFLRLSATAGAGAFILPNTAAAAIQKTTATTNSTSGFPVRTLGRTGIQVPIISMGVMRADNPNVVRAAYNSGITFFDTAHGYQNGRNEEMLGNFFKGKPRDSFRIATKVKFDQPLKDNFETEFADMFDISLKRLQMDYVDILYAHDMKSPEIVKDGRVIEALKKLKAEGKIRHAGFSMHNNNAAQIDAAIEAGIYDVILLSYNFKLEKLKELDEAIARGAEAGIGFVAMKTMTGGSEDAEGKTQINGQACLRWVWSNEHIATAIPGFTSFDLLEDCLAAAQNPQLTPNDKEYLAQLCGQELLYCQQCGKCQDQCPENLPIPDIMRAYMYAYGYKNAGLSKETLAELNLAKDVCKKCDTCKVNCISGFDVAGKIAAITPVMQVSDVFLS
ncbi:putative aldo/keto reductase-like oxidoreductase [Parabacteroides sp. PF5-5]|uniref:aldo/keto reductase n=1 Tax=unclassified Parabacteroides TaxID=2649774 RepID=UPI002474D97A|nr:MULTISPECIES: aldo/keto reductase [unclassified Parabacteroides]MDH6303759.1 putative aldo/keto reductase-like oxidoreductase [Parabacteroides sp. PH5-39]MDH6314376.1 putative aldo/keto reductase-like oxidoreductase [Parabacteroides sp. PF5-13]MDH6318559.1 putative aldo/keto reductase-like oxidoreductase [Parabacteroides sp. PH5-13]MDH6322148.1 putative aldo/keto reductase-like oxidoreductase [Parabacteroides sp. PH5-8]MDH6325772.1 putative aldo/keto reductase-like oxidoreductase [Parabacte